MVVSKLLIDEPPLMVLPSLAKVIGLNEALVLQQVHYRAGRSEDGWVQTTVAQWRRQFPFWGEATIKRIFARLREAGLVVVEAADDPMDRTNRYRIDHDELAKRSGATSGSKRSTRPDQSDPARADQSDPMELIKEERRTTETPPRKSPSSNGNGKVETAAFVEWISDHAQVTGYREPRAGTKVRSSLASSFAARVDEGYPLEDLKLATRGAHADDFRRQNGYDRAESVLRPTKIHDLIEKGRRAAAADQDAGKLNSLVCN